MADFCGPDSDISWQEGSATTARDPRKGKKQESWVILCGARAGSVSEFRFVSRSPGNPDGEESKVCPPLAVKGYSAPGMGGRASGRGWHGEKFQLPVDSGEGLQ